MKSVNTQQREPDSSTSPWSPLSRSVFRALWLATVASNLGTWLQNVGAAWLMTSLSPTSFMVALVQTAASLPVFLLSVPAGALADVMDRRRLLLFTQTWMLVVAAVLALGTWAGLMNATLLLFLTFLLGTGAALNGPAWEAIVPDLVPKTELPAAVALSSVAFNIARALGPALGGLVIAAAGPAATFAANAASFIGVIVVLYRWRSPVKTGALPAERFWGAIRAGVRYVRYSALLQAVVIRAALFVFCASALWALLPIRTRQGLGLGPTTYGMLLGALGAGALAGAALLPRLRSRYSKDQVVVVATFVFAAATIALAQIQNFILLSGAMILGGVAWVGILSTLNVAAMTGVPEWVRSRALSVYMLVFGGGLALGSAGWGSLANHVGVSTALIASAAGLGLGIFAAIRFSLGRFEEVDLEPSRHWPDPVVVGNTDGAGAAIVTIEYHIDPDDEAEFTAATRELRIGRLRDGALDWHLLADVSDPARFVEYFLVESWLEHLRQHERVTQEDKRVQDRVNAFHRGSKPPKISHFLVRR
jgi:MFS family permease